MRKGEKLTLPPAPLGGAGAVPGRRRCRRLPVRNAGRGGSAARGLGGWFEWSRGAEGGGGHWRPEQGWGTAAPEGQEARPAPRARGKPQCSEAAAATASAGGWGGGPGRVEAARPPRALSPGSRDKACCPLGGPGVSAAAATIAGLRGFSGYVVKGPNRILPFREAVIAAP